MTKQLEQVFREIRTCFELLDDKQRKKLIRRLTKLSNYGLGQNSDFDPARACSIRKSSKKTLSELGQILGMHEISVWKMENDELPFDSNKPKHQTYLKWLIENGY